MEKHKRINKMIRNVSRVLRQADAIDVNEGRVAYFRYKEVCYRIAERYGYPIEKVIAVFAALSPNLDYRGNIRSALSVIEGHKNGVPVNDIVSGGYNHCRDRAYSYLNGVSFLDTVKGKKIRSFYHNIRNPLDPYYVTIDGHAVNAARNEIRTLKSVTEQRFNYDEVAEAFRFVAKTNRILPSQLQATAWFTWKRINKIMFEPQLGLMESVNQDQWRTLTYYEEATPYGTKQRNILGKRSGEVESDDFEETYID